MQLDQETEWDARAGCGGQCTISDPANGGTVAVVYATATLEKTMHRARIMAAAPAMERALREWLDAVREFAEFERENPNDSTSRWERLLDAKYAKQEAAQNVLRGVDYP